jgi:rubredoxin/hemerythrin-like domain-containing protein
MKEHRLIEQFVSGAQLELAREKAQKTVNFVFLETAIDFFRTYADRCHHGKEENILFRELENRQISPELLKIMHELISEHVYARKVVGELASAKAEFALGKEGSLQTTIASLQKLVEFYPMHIAKEDKSFFYPAMSIFTEEEQQKIMQHFWEFDRQLIHDKYEEIVKSALASLQRIDSAKWKCTVCDYVYDPQKGDPEHGIKPGTAFKELPEDWTCPICFAPKSAFKEVA